ncbi:MAG: hypothetical protein A2Z34_00175 [Planctomycetes bacterium RBG_16_59_8]|nr:MAG: hypothetical protein A2Z34_00175 [Planctomycetes bacterium RBG_16_59_8]
MKKLIVELPDPLHRRLRETALEENRTMKNIVTDLVAEYVVKPHPHPAGDSAELRGSWDDPRPAEEIVADIMADRRWMTKRSKDRAK